MLIEIPGALLSVAGISAGAVVVAAGLTVSVLLLDYAFDKVKE